MIPIVILLLSGKCFELEVPEDARVVEVKQIISRVEFVGEQHNQRLLLGIEELADAELLKKYDLSHGNQLTLIVEFGCCSKTQNPLVAKVLAAMEKQAFKPGTPRFERAWKASAAPEVSLLEFDRLVEGTCGVMLDAHVHSALVKILGFWFQGGESWKMMNPEVWQGQVTAYSNNMKLFKHELYRVLMKEARSSSSSVTTPELAFFWQTNASGMVSGYDLIGNPTVYPFSSNLLLHYYTPLQSILEEDQDTTHFITPCSKVSLTYILYALWDVASQGHRRVYGRNSNIMFAGRKEFNVSDWTTRIPSSETLVVHEGDVVSLLHVQTQLSAGICPVVIGKDLCITYSCFLANANGSFLKVIDSEETLDMYKLRCFVREALCESRGKSDILIVVTGLSAFSRDVRLCSDQCRFTANAQPRRLSVVLCGRGLDPDSEM